ncbi:MAG: hypothetical protein RQ936_02280 [Gammaproteobacteria bacterium]|nr:hypothetical protein [Gammaproteobacteria bacterium]
MKNNRNDWSEVTNGVEDVIGDLESCIDDAINYKETKTGVIKSVLNLSGSLTRLAFRTTSAVVSNAPKAIVAAADLKREFVDGVENGMREFQKQQKEDALDKRIKQIKLKTLSQNKLTIDD